MAKSLLIVEPPDCRVLAVIHCSPTRTVVLFPRSNDRQNGKLLTDRLCFTDRLSRAHGADVLIPGKRNPPPGQDCQDIGHVMSSEKCLIGTHKGTKPDGERRTGSLRFLSPNPPKV